MRDAIFFNNCKISIYFDRNTFYEVKRAHSLPAMTQEKTYIFNEYITKLNKSQGKEPESFPKKQHLPQQKPNSVSEAKPIRSTIKNNKISEKLLKLQEICSIIV